jgi:hypothetical protein
MSDSKEKLQTVQNTIAQTQKLLNDKDKKSDAYKIIKKDLDGLKALERIAKSRLKKDISNIKENIKKAKKVRREARNDRDRTIAIELIRKLQKELEKLEE